MAEEQPVTLPEAKPVVNPTGEYKLDSYVDVGAHSPAKYPTFDKKRKRKAPKKVPEFGPNSFDLDNHTAFDKKTKREAPKKIPEAPKKKARKNLTLDLPKAEGTVRFDTIVLVKLGKRQTMMLLKGYSLPGSTFYKKRQQNKLNMRKRHQQREMTPKRMKIRQHVRDTMAKVNSVLVL